MQRARVGIVLKQPKFGSHFVGDAFVQCRQCSNVVRAGPPKIARIMAHWTGAVIAPNGVVRAVQRTKTRVVRFNQKMQHHVCPIGDDFVHLRIRITFGV